MGKRQEGHEIERWHDYEIRVDDHGTFFALDEGKDRAGEAKTLAGLKEQLAKTVQVTPVYGVMFDWYNEGVPGTAVTVYGVSGLWAVLYEAGGRKHRASRSESIYLRDAGRIKRRKELIETLKRLEAERDQLMESWPVITRETLEKMGKLKKVAKDATDGAA